MARTNDTITPGGDRSEPENFKWECIGRSNRNCPLRRDQMSGDRSEPTESELNEDRQRQQVDTIKFAMVTVALLGVLCGAAVVYLLDNGEADAEPIHYQKYNSYFGGLIRVVKVDGSSENRDPSTEIHIKMEVPDILVTLGDYLAAGYDGTLQLLNSIASLWTGQTSCDCPNQPM
ncbi:unnamed protein product [Allacma fusca]|uniref:Uncharacterized protein n=1 Tax=Allacma fusca TaxID=39272 RepID=A0A8J2K7I3_9HEXA|nr:unnamed protein product [Allacma fusca]